MDEKKLIEALTNLDAKTKADLLAAAMEDEAVLGEVLDRVNAVKTRVLTQDYVDKRVIPAILKTTVRRSDYEEMAAERDRLDAELKKAKQDSERNPDWQRQLQQLKTEHEASFQAIKKAYEDEKSLRESAEQKRRDYLFNSKLEESLVKAGIRADKVRQARLIARDEIPHLCLKEDDDGQSAVAIINPTTKIEKDAESALRAWAEQNKHFVQAKPSGGGASPAGPGVSVPPKDWREGKSDDQQWAEAILEYRREGPRKMNPDGDNDLRGGGET